MQEQSDFSNRKSWLHLYYEKWFVSVFVWQYLLIIFSWESVHYLHCLKIQSSPNSIHWSFFLASPIFSFVLTNHNSLLFVNLCSDYIAFFFHLYLPLLWPYLYIKIYLCFIALYSCLLLLSCHIVSLSWIVLVDCIILSCYLKTVEVTFPRWKI